MQAPGSLRLLVVIAALTVLAACGGSDDNKKAASNATTQASAAAASGGASVDHGQIPGSKSATGKQPLGTGQLDASKKPIKVPFTTFVTGAGAFVAKSQLNGAKAYVDWLNGHGGINGHKLDMETWDDQSDPAQTI